MTRETGQMPPVVIILGMHRSGTSCLAGSLEEAGLYLGAVNKLAPHNAKGNQENAEIMKLHESVLTSSGGSWDDPPRTAIWSGSDVARRQAIVASYPSGRPWGFKDPRTLLTLDGWLDALPAAHGVGTFRHPLAVARSLSARNGFSQQKGLGLWLEYNRRLLHYQRRLDIGLVCFDWAVDRYHQALGRFAAALGLAEPAQGFSFLDPALRRHQVPDSAELPDEVEATYRALEEIAAGGEAGRRTAPA